MSFKDKLDDFKFSCEQKWDNIKSWCGEHKEIVVGSIPVIGMIAVEVFKETSRTRRHMDEEHRRNRTIYDASHRHYIRTKRDIKQREYEEIDRRHDLGENYYDILRDMKIKTK